MKTVKSAITALVCGLLLASTACKKKEVNLGTPPTINLKTGNGYLANNDTVTAGDTVIMGVTASANYAPDKLQRLIIRRSINFADLMTLKQIDIGEDQNETYSGDFKFVLQTVGNQQYTFIVENTHGLEGEVLLTVTVTP